MSFVGCAFPGRVKKENREQWEWHLTQLARRVQESTCAQVHPLFKDLLHSRSSSRHHRVTPLTLSNTHTSEPCVYQHLSGEQNIEYNLTCGLIIQNQETNTLLIWCCWWAWLHAAANSTFSFPRRRMAAQNNVWQCVWTMKQCSACLTYDSINGSNRSITINAWEQPVWTFHSSWVATWVTDIKT